MTDHIFDELPRLLTGQSTQDELRTSVAHLRTCVDCQQELIEALAAHASLSSAARYTHASRVRGLVSTSEPGSENVIGARFGDDARGEADAETGTQLDAEPEQAVEPATSALPARSSLSDLSSSERAPLPDLSALFSAVRSDAAGADGLEAYRISYEDLEDDGTVNGSSGADELAAHRHRRSVLQTRRFSGRWLVAAAAVGLGIGSAAVLAGQHQGTPATTNVALAAYDAGSVPATAKLVGSDDMKLDATALPKPASGSLYEVWLTNANRTKMHALGWIDSSGKGEFTLPTQLLDEYTAIEVSVQKLNSSYDYSGTSVLRGSY